MPASIPHFSLWLEFEHWQPTPDDDPTNNFFNMIIVLEDGRRYALNVWTFAYFARAQAEERASGEALGGRYLLPPDLFVERLDRGLLEEVVADLLRNGDLRKEWRTPVISGASSGAS
jgi:hypothetical protein